MGNMFQHVGQGEEGDHDVRFVGFLVTQLEQDGAGVRDYVFVRQHNTFGVPSCSGSVANGAQVLRFGWLERKKI